MSFNKTYGRLRGYVQSLMRDKGNLKPSDAFAYWFCQAALLHPDNEQEIRASLCGAAYDKNIDIVAWSAISEEVYVVQTKYRDSLGQKGESPNDMTAFANIAGAFAQRTEAKLDAQFQDANADVRDRFKRAWRLIHKERYALHLIYVSTGKFAKKSLEQAQGIVEASGLQAELTAYDGFDCCRIFLGFENLVPAIPFVTIDGVRSYMTPATQAEGTKAAVFSAPVAQIRKIFRKHRERLFARNVRLYKGEKSEVNREIRNSLREHPEHFFYLNNGITILASDIRAPDTMARSSGNELRIYEPQIINGQQTTRTIGLLASGPSSAEVLVKVICRRPDSDAATGDFRRFIYSVVRATNSQTKIAASELAANNPEQIEIARALEHLQWRYVRKTGASEELHAPGKTVLNGEITLKGLATAVVVCEHDPQFIRREGIESLFHLNHESLYRKVFSSNATDRDYLLAYLILTLAKPQGKKGSKRTRQLASLGQYFVAFMIRRLLDPVYKKWPDGLLDDLSWKRARRRFSPPLHTIQQNVAAAWISFYKDRADEEEDPLSFVSRYASRPAWQRYWKSSSCAARRAACAKALKELPSPAA